MSFNLNISEDTLSNFMNKYEDKPSANLPVLQSKKELSLKNIMQSIKEYFL